jgi:elongation factor G
LKQLRADDPSLVVKSSANGMVTVGASSEDQLDAAVYQLVHRFGIDADISDLHIAYKETVTRAAEGESKQPARPRPFGHLYAHVKIRVEPGETGSGRVFENAIVGGAIHERMITPVKEGIDEILDRGVLAGHPIDDVHVSLSDGSYHDVDSSDLAFKIAGRLAFLDAARRAKPILLEPIMNVSVVTPFRYGSRVFDGLRARGAGAGFQFGKGTIAGFMTSISTLVPLSQMFGYGAELRARTDRRGTFTMTFSHYAPAILSEDDRDRAADVTAPLLPRRPPLILRAAVPEPRD